MNENKNICPCCGKGCDLSVPRCPRGEEYLSTGVIPPHSEHKGRGEHEKGHRENDRHEHMHGKAAHEHGCHKHEDGHKREGCKFQRDGSRFSHYSEMDTNDKILSQMSKLTHQSHMLFGGRGGQKRILHILSKEGTMTQRELTERLEIQPGSASEIIKKLEIAGYILRSANEADRRTADISLTEAGLSMVNEAGAQRKTHLDELFAALTAEETEQLLALLEKLSAGWDTRCRGENRHGRGHHKEG